MEEYIQQIERLTNPTFQQIRQIANTSIYRLSTEEQDSLWKRLNHGVDLLDSHELMCKYLYSYGNMHEAKIHTALEKVQNLQNILNDEFSIIDWGCGQGLATICFFDYIKQKNITNKVQKVVLIEPS